MSMYKTLETLAKKYDSSSKKEKIKQQITDIIRKDPREAERFLENNLIGDEISEIIQTELLLIENEKLSQEESDENKNPIDFKRNFSIYWQFLKKGRLLFIITLIIVLISQVLQFFERFLFGYLIDILNEYHAGEILFEPLINTLLLIAILFIGAVIIISLSHWFQHHFVNIIEQRIIKNIKKKFFSHLLYLDHRFHSNHSSGKLISKIDRGAYATETITDVLIFIVLPTVLSFIIVFGSVLYLDLNTAITIFLVVFSLLFHNFYLLNKMKKYKVRSNKALDFEKGYISDSLSNIESIKYYSKERHVSKKFSSITNNVYSKTLKFIGFYRYFASIDDFIIGIGTFFIILFPVIGYLNGELSLGAIAFIYTSYGSLIGPLLRFANGSRNFYEAMGDLQQLFDYNEVVSEVQDKPHAHTLQVKQGKITFENVTFNYDAKNQVLENFTFTINPKETVALVGESGSGKTTLIKLLYRLYDIQEGSITIDDVDIRDVTQESLREELSIVPQETILFDDTLYNNILFSKPTAKQEEVFEAIRFAKLNEVIEKLPKKEKTIVGVRGIKLSGGQKQRVSIARALLANKNILVLDEATSALDSKLEHEIQKELKSLMKGRTSLVIAHRLSTIMNADKIVVVENGQVLAIGTHNELLEKSERYRELWSLQMGGFIE